MESFLKLSLTSILEAFMPFAVYFIKSSVIQTKLTKDDACHGCTQTKLLLKVFGAESYKALDYDCVACVVQDSKYVRTVCRQRLRCFENTSKTCSAEVQWNFTNFFGVRWFVGG